MRILLSFCFDGGGLFFFLCWVRSIGCGLLSILVVGWVNLMFLCFGFDCVCPVPLERLLYTWIVTVLRDFCVCWGSC
jgi:hypothetical protein